MKNADLVRKLNEFDVDYLKTAITSGLEKLDELGLNFQELKEIRDESDKHLTFINDLESFIVKRGSLEKMTEAKLAKVVEKYDSMQAFRYELYSLSKDREPVEPQKKIDVVFAASMNK